MTSSALTACSRFVVSAEVPARALEKARSAFLDTVGVTLAGAVEPAARIVQDVVAEEGGAPTCRILGTSQKTGPAQAALANGTAAHALDYDDMCFVSLAHPSAPLVAACLACGELAQASGRTALDAYVVGFEIEAMLGRAMNVSHYRRGWHCTSTIGTIGAAAAAARVLGLDADATGRCLSIAASEASGLKENFGTMAKPLHAGLAARNGVVAALLARKGFTASALALDGPQGMLTAMDAERPALDAGALGARWEILETGITVKLYPSCAATHPALDGLLELRRQHGLSAETVDTIVVRVDSVTPTVLLYGRPGSPLEAKFSMPFCAAAAIADGQVGIDTFETDRLHDPALLALLERVTMTVDPELGQRAPALTQAAIAVRLKDGRLLTREIERAKGCPERPASAEELEAKFRACARRVMPAARVELALDRVRAMAEVRDIRELTLYLSGDLS